ncbi:MAG: hypothetical protein QW768_06130 [Thermoproteota archaeon]|nr:hypothetical protein [Candidatus Brockarchaeota archaeon]
MFLDYNSVTKILRKKIKNAQVTPIFIRVLPVYEDSVDEILIRKYLENMLSMDPNWEMTGVLNVCSEERMNEDMKDMFRKLKTMEFDAAPSLVFAKPNFQPTEELVFLKKRLELNRSEELVNLFRENKEFIGKFKRIRPAKFKVALDSFPDEYAVQNLSPEVKKEVIVDYFYNPRRLRFFITASSIISSPNLGRTINELFDLVILSGKIVRKFLEIKLLTEG